MNDCAYIGEVTTWSQVRANLITLERYRKSSISKYHEFYAALLGNGACYVACIVDGRRLFGPSRFVGYVRKTLDQHLSYPGHGTYSSQAIQRALKKRFVPSVTLERAFQDYCKKNGIVASRKRRKFLDVGEEVDTTLDSRLTDETEILRRRDLTATEKETLVDARRGQGTFRSDLLRMWHKCPVTGCCTHELLRASHIKPWSESSDRERLNPCNGLLLAAHVDAAFDKGLITFDDSGKMIVSRRLPKSDLRRLGLTRTGRVPFSAKNGPFLAFHREHVFEA